MFRDKAIEKSITEYIFSFRLHEKRYRFVQILIAVAVCNDILLYPSGSFTLPYAHSFSLFSLFDETKAKIFSVVILLFYILGFVPVITSMLFFWLCYSLRSAEYAANGGNFLVMILAFLMIPLSIVSAKKKKAEQIQFVLNASALLSIFTIRLQVSVVYFFSAWAKLKDVTWRDGSAIFFWANEPYTGWPNWMDSIKEYFFQYSLPSTIISWSVIGIEFLISFAYLFSKPIKNKIFISAIIFHLMIAIFHGLVSFSLVMIAALILFIRPLDKNEKKIISYN
jgi:antimicrobial peptide system SdpB family protein